MPRLPVKRTLVLAQKQSEGETKGKLEAENRYRQSKAGQWRSLEEHLGKFFDAMAAKIDPIELLTIAGTTYFIHKVMLGAEEALANLGKVIVQSNVVQWSLSSTGGYGWVGSILNALTEAKAEGKAGQIPPLFSELMGFFNPIAMLLLPSIPQPPTTEDQVKQGTYYTRKQAQDEIAKLTREDLIAKAVASFELWLLSFIIAFVLIRYGMQIIDSLGGISGIASKLTTFAAL